MPVTLNFLSGKRKYTFGAILLMLISVISMAFSITGDDKFDMSRREVLLRKIGDELLLQSGDSTSRVLPVEKIAENEYQIKFEQELTFQTDSLVNITGRVLANDPLGSDYVVNVLNCGKTAVTYGYAISKNKKDNIVACKTRKQPKECYIIDIKFKPSGLHAAKNQYLLGGLSFLAFIGFVFLSSFKPRRSLSEQTSDTRVITLGSILFDAKNRKLIIHGNTTELTGTESRLLLIFALSPNKIIERSRLQKEIWEDEGVIVGRSLDMFISKLRKKLELDPRINIIVVRSKGYKLEINS